MKRGEEMTYEAIRNTQHEHGFTLIELLTVIVIIGILAALAIPNFNKTRERAIDKDAQSALQMIQAAEKIKSFRYNYYYPNPAGNTSSLTAINTDLGLSIPAGDSWNYSIISSGGPPTTNFNATAQRPDGSRTWWINSTAGPNCSNGAGGIPCP